MSIKIPKTIPIEDIVASRNVRTDATKDIEFLMSSIQQNGLLQPIGLRTVVTPEGTKFNPLWGHRRLSAMTKLGYKFLVEGKHFVFAEKYKDEADYLIVNLIENEQRVDVSPIELGKVCQMLFDEYGLSIGEIAARVNLPKGRIQQSMTLYRQAPPEFQGDIGFIYGGTAKKGKIPASTVASVIHRFSQSDRAKVLYAVQKFELSEYELQIVQALMQARKLSLEEAIAEAQNYKRATVELWVSRSKARELETQTGKPINKVIVQYLYTGVRLPKDLFLLEAKHD